MTTLFKGKAKSCYLLTDRFYRRYFSKADIAEGIALLTETGVTYFTDARYFYAAKPILESNGVTAILYESEDTVKGFIKSNGIKTIYIDFDTVTVTDFNRYKTYADEVLDGGKELKLIRSVKDKNEIDSIKKACAITQKAFYKTLERIKLGMTEKQVKKILLSYYRKYGADGESFDTIVAFGKNSAVPHHETGDSKLTENVPILIDTGCVVNGYASDYTRTVYFGKPDKKFTDCYNAVLKANELALEYIKAGVSCKDADGYARDVLKSYGLEEYFTHSLGHGLGLEIHEYPTLSKKSTATFIEGTAFTVEPGVYFDGEFGIRIEDTAVIINGKAQRLYNDEKFLIIL